MRHSIALAVLVTLITLPAPTGAVDDEPDPDGAFVRDGSLDRGRANHSATVLPSGGVLIIGGMRGQPLASVESWDPATSTFERIAPLGSRRAGHTATLLHDERVLVVGGDGGEGYLASAEVWDPSTRTFAPTGSLAAARADHSAVLLRDGRVLIVGGPWDEVPAGAEVWDPVSGTFEPAGMLAEPRSMASATLLDDGRVLVVCGSVEAEDGSDRLVTKAETWDPATSGFAPAGSLAHGRTDCTATTLEDGRVLVVGGADGRAELWDPDTATFEPVARTAEAHTAHTATLLHDGRVLIVGGWDTAGAEVWFPTTASFGPTGPPAENRAAHTASLLPDGRVLMVGGRGRYGNLERSEVWDPMLSSADAPAPTGPVWEQGAEAAAERLLSGVRPGVRDTCTPSTTRLPSGALAAVRCRPASAAVRQATITFFESESRLLDAYRDRLETIARVRVRRHDGRCEPGRPTDGAYVPTLPEMLEVQPFRRGCAIDQKGRAHYLATSPPFGLIEVVGNSADVSVLEAFAWRGSQDVPGAPTLWG